MRIFSLKLKRVIKMLYTHKKLLKLINQITRLKKQLESKKYLKLKKVFILIKNVHYLEIIVRKYTRRYLYKVAENIC